MQHRSSNVRLVTGAQRSDLTRYSVSTGNGQPSITLYDSTLEFRTDDDHQSRALPPAVFSRLRQEMAASRINKLLYASSSRRFADGAAATYMHLEADRLQEERGILDGVDPGKH